MQWNHYLKQVKQHNYCIGTYRSSGGVACATSRCSTGMVAIIGGDTAVVVVVVVVVVATVVLVRMTVVAIIRMALVTTAAAAAAMMIILIRRIICASRGGSGWEGAIVMIRRGGTYIGTGRGRRGQDEGLMGDPRFMDGKQPYQHVGTHRPYQWTGIPLDG
eukprot:scaffold21164_cov54-Attheya_sp.AAC.7